MFTAWRGYTDVLQIFDDNGTCTLYVDTIVLSYHAVDKQAYRYTTSTSC